MELSSFTEHDVERTEIVDGYHSNLLLVGATPDAARFAGLPAFHTLAAAEGEAPGLRLLSVLEQTGAVRRVYPLGQASRFAAPLAMSMGTVDAIVASAAQPHDLDPLAGASIVEMRSESDVPRVLEALAEDPTIEFASRVPVRYLVDDESVLAEGPLPSAQPPVGLMMWNLVKIGWPAARSEAGFDDAAAIRVAVLDTGIDSGHPDLHHAIESYVHQYAHDIAPVHFSDRDIEGHGTHVAGTIAAAIANGIGVHGICSARIHAYKIFNDTLTYYPQYRRFLRVVNPIAYPLALRACYETGVDVVNLSIGGPAAPDPLESRLFADLLDRGTIVVAAMGNDRGIGSPTSYPAAIPGVIAVGATGPDDRYARFSSAGRHIALCAPGTEIWSTLPTYPGDHGSWAVPGPGGRATPGTVIPRQDTDYGVLQGTSMASPHVAAACALILANRGSSTPAGVRKRLMDTAARQPWMKVNGDVDYGAGRLDLHAALFP
jgi:subtilisin family serine protease